MEYEPREAARLLRCPSQEIINKVCPSCPFFETKSGNEPQEIRQALSDALELEELFAIGFQPTFTEVVNGAISINQIAALKGLKLGRDLAEREKVKEIKKKTNQQTQSSNPQSGNSSSFE